MLVTTPAACRRGAGEPDAAHPHTAAVLSALDDERSHDLRLDGRTPFRACNATLDARRIAPPQCIAPDGGTAEALAREAVAIAADTAAAGTSDALWATAILDLTAGASVTTGQVDRAILYLTEVHAREPQLVLPRNHLALAYRIRAAQRQDTRGLYEAMDWIESALERDSTSSALQYNRASLETALHLHRVAAQDWNAVARTERDGDWRRDAATHASTVDASADTPSSVIHPAAIANLPSLGGGSATRDVPGRAAQTMVTGEPTLDALLSQAQQLSGEGLHRAAARVLHEARLAALAMGRAQDVPETLGRLAITQVQLGRTAAALALLTEARAQATAIRDTSLREHVTAGLDRAESMAMEARDPMAALRLLDASSRHFRQMPMEFVSLLSAAGRMASTAGDMARAERLLDSAVTMAAELAPAVTAAQAQQLRVVATESRRMLIDMALGRGDTAQAFARTVALPQPVIDVAGPGAVSAAWPVLAPTAGELRFVVEPASVLLWLRTRDGVRLHRWAASRDSVQRTISRLVRRVRTGAVADAPAGPVAVMSALLLGPLMEHIRPLEHLDVYTDDVVAQLPVGLLTDGTGTLLLERVAMRTVVNAPVHATPTAPPSSAMAGGPLLISDPAWSQRDFPALEPLRSADVEVRRIETLYTTREVLRGAEATRARVRERMPLHDVIHFAGHGVARADAPGQSQLVLAGGASFADGVLFASEIATLPLRGVRLVLLSACGVLDAQGSGLSGANPLATAFLEAGSGAVVAGRWDVDDDDSAALMAELHAEMQRGSSPEVALQRASVVLLRAKGTRARRLGTVSAYMVFGRAR